jgi:hypothetical protein
MSISIPHPYKSEKAQIALDIENTQKTEVTVTRYPGFLTGEQELPDPEIDLTEEHYVGGDRDPYEQTEGQWGFDAGSLTMVPYDGFPIAWAMGADSVAVDTPSAGLNTHTITRKQDGVPPTATMEAAYLGRGGQSDFVRTFLGCYPSSATIEQNNEGKLKVSADVQALGITADTPHSTVSSVSLPDRQPWKFDKVNSNLDLQFGGVSNQFARMTDFTFDIENNPTPEHYIESSEAPEPYELLYGNGGYNWDVSIAVTDNSLYNELVNSQGPFTATVTFEKGSNGDETLQIEGKECKMPSGAHPVPEEGKVETDLTLSPRKTTITVVDGVESTSYVAGGTNA